MIILILEPGYFASQRNFAACLAADQVILADHVRYRKKSIFNRTRIRNSANWQWLSIPLLPNMRKNPIFQVKTEDSSSWKTIHKRGLDYNYRTSPYYEHFEDQLENYFASELDDLGDWTYESMLLSCRLLGVSTPISRASEMLEIPNNMEALIQSCSDSKILVHEKDWWSELVAEKDRVNYDWNQNNYHQNFEGFISDMSILDLIFNHGPESIAYLKRGLEGGG